MTASLPDPSGPMSLVCAWCLRPLAGALPGPGPVSHGMCPACAERFLRDCPVPLEQFLDDLPVPVLVVDSDVTAGFANRQAQLLTGRAPEAIAGSKGGEVFVCINAQGEEGCGHTIHCSSCAIRTSVMRTFETGQPQVMVPAALKTGDPANPAQVALTITTVKRGGTVLLLVNGVD